MLETLEFIKKETDTWLEITTLLIPGANDSPGEIDRMTDWIMDKLGPDVPLHFTAFHPDFKMLDRQATPITTLQRSRDIALAKGIRYCYTGNVHDRSGQSTYCHNCGNILIGRDWYELSDYNLHKNGKCKSCGERCAGVFEESPGSWGARRKPVRLRHFS